MNPLIVICLVAAALWLLGMAACTLAFRWTFLSTPKRFWPALVLSLVGMGLGWLGLNRIALNWSQTVNGRTQWRFDSKWFFTSLLIAGGVTLGYGVWKRIRGQAAPGSAPASRWQ